MQNDLLIEGGAAGHMNHLYDNGDLTFAKMKEIFTAAAEGKLEGTEKTDGQNLMISYSVKDGRAKGVRNKTEIKNGGLTPEQLAAKFADRENPALKETFKDALKAFERAIHEIDHKTQIELFGEDTNIYYNAEVMDPRTPNVINYDKKTLVIHRAGHGDFDRTTGARKNTDLSNKAEKLEQIIIKHQENSQNEEYGVQVNAIKKLKALSDKQPLNRAISSLNSTLSSVNYLIGNKSLALNDQSTISEFMIARIYILINSILEKQKTSIGGLEPSVKMSIAKRILGVEGIKINDINKKLSPEQKKYVSETILNQTAIKNLLKTAINPVEMIVSNFATDMLKGLQSAFILDNAKEVKRLRGEVNGAISAIQSSGNEEAMSILAQQLKKLKSADNVSATAEGFVFDYDGITYKFTGNFAPVNQILGLFKYGRGSVPAIKKPLSEAVEKKADVAVVPGAFKPPHKGHIAMIEAYSKKAKKVAVLVSPLARTLPDGRGVTFEKSKQIFELFFKELGLTNVEVIKSEQAATPVEMAFQFIGNKDDNPLYAQPGQTILLGTSTKGGDEKRYSAGVDKYVKPGVKAVVSPVEPFFDEMSATDMRKYISNSDVKGLEQFIPDKIKNKKDVATSIIEIFKGAAPPSDSELTKKERDKKSKISKNNLSEQQFYDMIKEAVLNIVKRHKKNKSETKINNKKQYFKHMKEMSSAGAGSAVQGAPVIKDREE